PRIDVPESTHVDGSCRALQVETTRESRCRTTPLVPPSSPRAAPRRPRGDDGGVTELLPLLHQLGEGDDRLLHVERIPARPGRTGDWPAWADSDLVAGYRRLGVEAPWEHQVEAAESVWSGRHTVIATATGSGKSLAAWLPAISAVREGAEAAAGPGSGRIAGYARR